MKHIKASEFDDVINSKEMTVVDFFATWCMPCKMVRPILEKIEAEHPVLNMYDLDVEESEQIAMRYRIFSVPTLVCFKDGKKLDSMVGANSYEDILDFLNRCAEMGE